MSKLFDMHLWGKYANEQATYKVARINDVTWIAVHRWCRGQRWWWWWCHSLITYTELATLPNPSIKKLNWTSKIKFPQNRKHSDKHTSQWRLDRVLRCYIEPILMYWCEARTKIQMMSKITRSIRNVVLAKDAKDPMASKEDKWIHLGWGCGMETTCDQHQ